MFGQTSRFALVLSATLLSAGCGDQGNKKKSTTTAPESIRAEIASKANEGNGVKITYKANVSGARFKCQSEPQGGNAGDWHDCPSEGELVTGQPGQRMTFRVKAISAAGAESEAVTTTLTIPGQQQAPRPMPFIPREGEGNSNNPSAGNEGEEQSAGTTVILNKEQLATPVEQSSVTLSLGVREGRGPVEQYKFECMLESAGTWMPCSGNGEHTIDNLEPGKSYTLKVRGIFKDGSLSKEDVITFNAAGQAQEEEQPGLVIKGEQQLRDARSGNVRLSWDKNQVPGMNVQCQINQQKPVACLDGYSVNIGALSPGPHNLTIMAGEFAPVVIPFCAVGCDVPPQPVPPKQILVGDTIHFVVPETMHVTTYSTTQTATTRLNFIQVMNDPYFVGNYNCNGTPMDRPFMADNYQYCNVTPNGPLFDWLTDRTVAPNHVEVATNAAVIAQNPMAFDRIIINQFDSAYEFNYVRSRFSYLCRNVQPTVTVTPYPIRMVKGFWRLDDVRAQYASCYAPIANTGPELWQDQGGFAGWWIGTFFIATNEQGLPTPGCLKGYNPYSGGPIPAAYSNCAQFHAPQLIEVTIMTRRQFAQPAQFDAWSQAMAMDHMTQFTPFFQR